MASTTMSFDNPVFKSFCFYATVMVVKLLAMGILTAYHRITKKVFINPEDVTRFKGKVAVNPNHPDVERARRNHLNDIENIFPFVLVGFMYIFTGPSLYAAQLHFRIFAGSRILHTFIYQLSIGQPFRALSHGAGLGCTISMAYQVLQAAKAAM